RVPGGGPGVPPAGGRRLRRRAPAGDGHLQPDPEAATAIASPSLTVMDPASVLGWCCPEPALTTRCEPVTFDSETSARGGDDTLGGLGRPLLTSGVMSYYTPHHGGFTELMGARCAPISRPQGSLFVRSKVGSDQSGRPDLNRRPLDPQSRSGRRWAWLSVAQWALDQA